MRKKYSKWLGIAASAAVLLTSIPAMPVSAAPAGGEKVSGEKPLKLHYAEPANKGKNERDNWERWALPIGNGHMGAMVFGRTDTERIQMNEKTLWSGGPGGADDAEGGEYDTRDPQSDAYGNVDAQASGAMEKYIDYLFDLYYDNGKGGSAPAQSGEMKLLPNNRSALGDYQNFAEMYLDFNHAEEKVMNYNRELDLRTALSTVEYDYEGVTYTREMFADYPDNVMVYHVTASEDGKIDMVLRPEIADLGTTKGGNNKKVTKEGTVIADEKTATITMEGKMVNNDMKFAGLFHVESEGGTVTAQNPEVKEFPDSKGQLTISDADSVTIYITLATNYQNVYPNYRQEDLDYAMKNVTERMENAKALKYEKLRNNHLEDYQELFSRVELNLGGTFDQKVSTDKLLSDWKKASANGTQNHYLEELYFQYGRYMMIASSRADTLPSNLQGIWNDRAFADWQSDYHTNINLQMNYWPAYTTNLKECGLSLVDYVDSLQEPGAVTANKLFGTENAWMVNCSANALGFTGNINSSASLASTANAFILQNVYDHYQFTQDKEMLQNTIYPMMAGACNFFLQVLQSGRSEADVDKLFMAPSYSSEQNPWTIGAFFDQQLIYLLFQDTLDAAEELGIEDEFTSQVKDAMERIYPVEIGESGQIKEWQQEGAYNRYESTGGKIGDDAHRHNSQLMVLHPGNVITTETPELMQAAKNTLNLRGDGATGWSMGQKFNMWARLQDGNHAYDKLFVNLMKNGTATNLFDLHPPFQIDGNFGGTAGLAELLVQSHAGYVSVLPALPDALSSGSVKGLVTEGNFEIDMEWADKEWTSLTVTSGSGKNLAIKAGVIGSVIDTTTGTEVKEFVQKSDGSVSFATEAGHTYEFRSGKAVDLSAVETLVKETEAKGILSYANTTETGDEFEEAFLACKRMVEQENYVNTNVEKTAERLEKAIENLKGRGAEQYAAVIALHFLENAETLNYKGSKTEDIWRQEIEYDRADLMEALLDGSKENTELTKLADTLVDKANKIGEYPKERLELYDLLKKARNMEQGSRTEEEWEAYFEKIDAFEVIFANPEAGKKDLEQAYEELEALMKTMEKTFRITASVEGEGTITPNGKVTVLGGASQKFVIAPAEGNGILDVLVDGKSVGTVAEYTIADVVKDTTIKAIFQKAEETKSEAEILLDHAIAKAESLNGEDYTKDSWNKVTEALEAAKNADRKDEAAMKQLADTLLDAIDGLESWSNPIRTEAESSDKWPVANYNSSSVYTDPANWGEKELPAGGKMIGGYPENGPTGPGSGGSPKGQWDVQTVKNPDASGQQQMFTKSNGAWVKFRFEGKRVRYITEVSTGGALVDVYIDGEKVAQVECWNSQNFRNAVYFDSEDYDLDLKDGSHELKLVCVGKPSGQSSPIFRVDAFDEYTTNETVDMKHLAELIAEASSKSQALYTEASWNVLMDALEAAEDVYANAGASSGQVERVEKDLEAALKNLEKANADIVKVTELNGVNVPYKTTVETLKKMLPTSVVVETESLKTRVDVEWNLKVFDGKKAGVQALEGKLILPKESGITNEKNLKAKIEVAVQKGEAKVMLKNLSQTEGSVKAVEATTEPKGLKVKILYDGLDTLPNKPGKYHVTATVVDDNYEGSVEGTLVIKEKIPEVPEPGDPDNPIPEDPDGDDQGSNKPDKPDNGKPGTGNGNNAVQTGDCATMIPALASMLAAAGAIVAVLGRRKQKR